jgi:hypothetical protein
MLNQKLSSSMDVAIHCPKCGIHGTAVWETETSGPLLVSLSDAFYERLARFTPYRIEIVCHACGTPQPQRAPRQF